MNLELGGQARGGLALPEVHIALHELDEAHSHAVTDSSQREAERGGGLALSIARVYVNQPGAG
jgi:hypothetical protein